MKKHYDFSKSVRNPYLSKAKMQLQQGTMTAVEPIDGTTATTAELLVTAIDALVKALGLVGMARFLHQFGPGRGDYTADRDRILGNPTVDDLMDELKERRQRPPRK
jgi:hypothetical protein